jgi:PilZ domain
MNDPMTSETTAAKRGLDRDSLLLKAILRFPRTKDEGEVRIRNLSAGGLMAEAPLRIARGELVEIHLRSIGWISGHVAWVTEGRLGIAFDHPINPKDARKPVGTTEHEMPHYLKKLNNPAAPSKLRRM